MSSLSKAALAIAVIITAGSVWVAINAHSDAKGWEDQIASLRDEIAAADAQSDKLISELNEKTSLVNSSAAKLARAQSALDASEDDVSSLANRQRQLADEKAHLEDQRAQLAQLTIALDKALKTGQACRSGLYDLIIALARDNYASVQATADSTFDVCDLADKQFQVAQGIAP